MLLLESIALQARGSYYWCWHGDVLADTFRWLWVELGMIHLHIGRSRISGEIRVAHFV